jgi:uncharacterized coiled-coil DUF342 family protein
VKALVQLEILKAKKLLEKKAGDLDYLRKKIEGYHKRLDKLADEKTGVEHQFIEEDEKGEDLKKKAKKNGVAAVQAQQDFQFLSKKHGDIIPTNERLLKRGDEILKEIPEYERKNEQLKQALLNFEKKVHRSVALALNFYRSTR